MLSCGFPRSSQVVYLHREFCLPAMTLPHASGSGIERIWLLPAQDRHYILKSPCSVPSMNRTCSLRLWGWIARTKTFEYSTDNILPSNYYCLPHIYDSFTSMCQLITQNISGHFKGNSDLEHWHRRGRLMYKMSSVKKTHTKEMFLT